MAFDRNLLPDPASYFENHGLALKGPSSAKWKTTTCSFHGGSDSMRVNVQTGAWKCMNCGEGGGDVLAFEMKFHGTEFVDSAKAIGAWTEDGKPSVKLKPTPLSPRQCLSVIGFEATLVAVAAGNLANGIALTATDIKRLFRAANRITRIVEDFP